MGVTTVSNSLILGGWVTNILKNWDEKWGVGGKVGGNNILTFYATGSTKNATLKNRILGNFFQFVSVKFRNS